MKTTNFLTASIMIVVLFLCNCKSPESSEAIIVKYNSYLSAPLAFENYLSDIAVVPLETTDQCLISSVQRVELIDSLVIIGDADNIFLFNTDGKFISRIGRQGRGAGEYLTHSGFFVNGGNIVVLDPNNGKLNQYDFSGKYISSESLPDGVSAWGYCAMPAGDDEVLIFNQFNPLNNMTYTVMDMNKPEDSRDLYLTYDPIKLNFAYSFANHPMTRSGNAIHLTMPLDNTLYEYSGGAISPKYTIDTPQELIPKEDMAREAERTRSYLGAMLAFTNMERFGGFTDIFETDNYVFLHYFAKQAMPGLFIFDKKTNIGNYFVYPLTDGYLESPIFPISTSNGNKLLSVVQQTHAGGASFSIPQQLKAYVETQGIPVEEIPAPLQTMLDLADENNNPFLVFYTVK